MRVEDTARAVDDAIATFAKSLRGWAHSAKAHEDARVEEARVAVEAKRKHVAKLKLHRDEVAAMIAAETAREAKQIKDAVERASGEAAS